MLITTTRCERRMAPTVALALGLTLALSPLASALNLKQSVQRLTSVELKTLALAQNLGQEATAELEADPLAHWSRSNPLEASLLAGRGAVVSSPRKREPRASVDDTVVKGTSNMVMGMVLIPEEAGPAPGTLGFGTKNSLPQWLEIANDRNQKHCERHGHSLVIRKKTTLGEPDYQSPFCQSHLNDESFEECKTRYERVNNNWEKEAMMLDYLEKPGVDYVLIMDVDAVLVQPSADTIRNMARELERSKRDVLLTDEDWRERGQGHLNGGVLFAKSTDYARAFFRDLLKSHALGMRNPGPAPKCQGNEQLCLQACFDPRHRPYPNGEEQILIASGARFNRGSCTMNRCPRQRGETRLQGKRLDDPELEIMHFMGMMKDTMVDILARNGTGLMERNFLEPSWHNSKK